MQHSTLNCKIFIEQTALLISVFLFILIAYIIYLYRFSFCMVVLHGRQLVLCINNCLCLLILSISPIVGETLCAQIFYQLYFVDKNFSPFKILSMHVTFNFFLQLCLYVCIANMCLDELRMSKSIVTLLYYNACRIIQDYFSMLILQ